MPEPFPPYHDPHTQQMRALYKTKDHLDPLLLLDHEIDAGKEAVYKAWTDLELFQQWFRPTGFSIARAEMDPQVGGYFRIHMKSPDGEIYPTKGEYILLDAPDRIVYKDSWDDDRAANEPTIAEIVFEAKGDKTLLKIYSSFASEEQKESLLNTGITDGWKMFLENLNKVLKAENN